LDDEEHLVLRVVMVPRERPPELHELHLLSVQLGDDLGAPVLREEPELLGEVDLPDHGPEHSQPVHARSHGDSGPPLAWYVRAAMVEPIVPFCRERSALLRVVSLFALAACGESSPGATQATENDAGDAAAAVDSGASADGSVAPGSDASSNAD